MSLSSDRQGGHHTRLDYHERLISDVHRMEAFHRALSHLVKPGMTVLDAGTGTGVLAMMAARLGAEKVYAVESSEVANLAERLIKYNQLDNKIELIRGDLRTLKPRAQVDLVISECLGRFVVDDLMVEAAQAATAWLKPDGILCPQAVELFIAPVSAGHFSLSDNLRLPLLGIDFTPLVKAIEDEPWGGSFGPESLLAPPQKVAAWHLGETFNLDFEGNFDLRPGRLVGVAGWFRAHLAPGVFLETAPGLETHWHQMVWPCEPQTLLRPTPLKVKIRYIGLFQDVPQWSHSIQTMIAHPPSPHLPAAPSAFDAGVEAWQRGDLEYAARCFDLATTTEVQTPELWENIGIVRHALGSYASAVLPLLRALDGRLDSREQSLRLLVSCCFRGGRTRDGVTYLNHYETHYGPHPEGWRVSP